MEKFVGLIQKFLTETFGFVTETSKFLIETFWFVGETFGFDQLKWLSAGKMFGRNRKRGVV